MAWTSANKSTVSRLSIISMDGPRQSCFSSLNRSTRHLILNICSFHLCSLVQAVSFEKVKLTNNELDRQGQIVLNSMHKFQPRLHLVLLDPAHPKVIGTVTDLDRTVHKTFAFPQTIFTAVTAYQNQLVSVCKYQLISTILFFAFNLKG
jgi:T-box